MSKTTTFRITDEAQAALGRMVDKFKTQTGLDITHRTLINLAIIKLEQSDYITGIKNTSEDTHA